MLTSLGNGNEARQAHDSGIEAYLTKPVRQSELIDALGRVLHTETPPAPLLLTAAPGRRARVLVVEDNPVNQEVARAMLGELGCTIRVASDGREALAALRDEAFDLVFMDCQMPEMDGFEAVRRFRASAANGFATRSDTPVVALTANALAGDAERCLAAGFNDYLAKPVRREQLDAALARWAVSQEDGAPPREAPPIAIEDPEAPQAPVSPPARAIDPAMIELIRDMERRGSSRLLERLVATYITTAGKLIEKATHALKTGDAGALQLAVHTLKSSSANLGATALSRRFAELERLARSRELQAAQDEWNGVRIEFERAVQELSEIVAADEAVTPS